MKFDALHKALTWSNMGDLSFGRKTFFANASLCDNGLGSESPA
jgi:hypothetical protein